ncbi:Beta-glucoside kinase [Raoultella terrigena]|nr:Beta-glucoside kinase [Raoultella terrigena]
MIIAAFDIGGTALKMGTMTSTGELLEKGKQPIRDSDGEQILQAMLAWIAAHPECEGVAISAPGYVNPHTGYIEMGGAIRRFDNFAIKTWLEQRTRLPVAIENDANCVLLAERWQGKAANISDFLVLTIGTGIGGAIFCNDRLVHGASFRAGEFGYMQTQRPGARNVRRYSMNEKLYPARLTPALRRAFRKNAGRGDRGRDIRSLRQGRCDLSSAGGRIL